MADSNKSAKSWIRDLGMFGLGFVTGSGSTLALGILTNKVHGLPGVPAQPGASAPKK